jgi:hypothetical protein
VEVYIDYVERHPDGFRMAQRAAITDKDLHPLHQAPVTSQRDRILTGLGTVMTVDDEAKIAVTAWLAFAQTAILDWLDNRAITREQLRDLCTRALWAAAGPNSWTGAASHQ